MKNSFLKKAITIISVMAVMIMLGVTLAGCTGGYDATQKLGNVSKANSLNVKSDGKFTILQLADLHLTSNGVIKQDKETLRWVQEALDTAKPDLVELTGDAVGGGLPNRDKAVLALANLFEKNKVYWAYTFGNHDGEHTEENGKDVWSGKEGKQTLVTDLCSGAKDLNSELVDRLIIGDNTKGNKQIFELLKGYKYSLLSRSEEEMVAEDEMAMGVGNYVIDLKDNTGKTVFAIFHMDTHGKTYVDPVGNKDGFNGYSDVGYIGLTDKQVAWYESKVQQYSETGVASAIFMHVPNFEYRNLTEVNKGNSKFGIPQFTEKADIKYYAEKSLIPNELKSIDFVKEEGIYAPRWDEGLMDVIAKYPSTALISVGHDHNNSFMLSNNNVILGYGRTSGVNAWGRDIEIGASVFTINTKATTNAEKYKISIIQPSFKYTKFGTR